MDGRNKWFYVTCCNFFQKRYLFSNGLELLGKSQLLPGHDCDNNWGFAGAPPSILRAGQWVQEKTVSLLDDNEFKNK